MAEEYTPPHQHTVSNQPTDDTGEVLRRWGPPILGILVIILLLATGWYIVRNRGARPNQVLQASITPSPTIQPGSTAQPILPTPTPKPGVTQQPTPMPQAGLGVAKGGIPKGGFTTPTPAPKQLPRTGFPLGITAGISLVAILTGLKLRSFK